MRVTFLGSGGALCDHRVNYQNNALIEGPGGLLLLDCGTTAAQSLRELGVHACAIDAVALTHLHGDHASPEQLIWERTYSSPAGPPAFARTPLLGPADLIQPLRASLAPFIDIFSDEQGEAREGGVDALTEAVMGAEIERCGLQLRWFRVPHVRGATVDKAAYGVEISDGRSVIVWSGDTTFSPGWVCAQAARPEVVQIFHECMFHPPFYGTVHTHYSELQTLPGEVREKVVLMHHTAVPAGEELRGFAGAAGRHQTFRF